jgi:DNA-binding beta-propeller fold protein YncE
MQNSTLPSSGTGQSQSHSRFDLQRSGIPSSSFAGVRRLMSEFHRNITPDRRKRGGKKDLYVTDFGTGVVEILKNSTWANVGTISDGINGPDGAFVDKKGDIYVANYQGVTVTEYNKHNALKYTYSAGMTDPIAVTVDKHGNVYEGDYADGGSGFVAEYAQGSNTQIASCAPGGAVEGVAVDGSGDVFVDYNLAAGGAKITEYTGGLSGCHGTTLGVSLSFAGGMVLDKNNNIIVCDQLGPTVDVIDPPYNSVTGTLGSGFADPFHVTINKAETEAYVADNANANVQVLSYPSGTNITTLGASDGLSDPAAAVDGKNFVP